MIKKLLKLFGYEINPPSLLLMHMVDFTHSSWLEDLQNQNRLASYYIRH